MQRKVRISRRTRVALGGFIGVAALGAVASAPQQAEAVELIPKDLAFILDQIKISEEHAKFLRGEAAVPLYNAANPEAGLIKNELLPYGLRTVDGRDNNLLPGKANFGAADTFFDRIGPKVLRAAEGGTSYAQTNGVVTDSQPRTISNLVVDQSTLNPAAVAVGGPDPTFIPNTAPDEGLSAPFNSWFTLFGQFFDHGLDLVNKGGNGTVLVPLQPDDPIFDPTPGAFNTIPLTRATHSGNHEATNQTTSWVDQNQTYTSHPSHQVFLREYVLVGGRPVTTGRLLGSDSSADGLANWGQVKAQAETILGIRLTDPPALNTPAATAPIDVLNVPVVATDPYGKFIPGPNGFPQLVTGPNPTDRLEGNLTTPVTTATARRTGHAFLDDIAHHAAPKGDHDNNPFSPQIHLAPDANPGTSDDNDPTTFDDELLNLHFSTGDGRGNENIGLTSVHHVFHSEHNRLTQHVKQVIIGTGNLAVLNEWLATPRATFPNAGEIANLLNDTNPALLALWNGERVFQAARFVTEMQYQHLVFEEFARKVQPEINIFAGYHTDIDPRIVAEFAHTVYRFGHSMLTETVDRTQNDGTPVPDAPGDNTLELLEAFLNPSEFTDDGDGNAATSLSHDEGAGRVVDGMTRQVGNQIDEFVTPVLRNKLLGIPLDLATINLARGRDTGIPTLNAARRAFHARSLHPALVPYDSWTDFKLSLRNEVSLVNFLAAYGKHPNITGASGFVAKRAAAQNIVNNAGGNADFANFLDSTGPYAGPGATPDLDPFTRTGVGDIDFWIGGLAEKTMPFGGMLGPSFNYVFETQMEKLQDGDRFYYLGRTAGQNFLTQLEEASFAEMIMRNTDASKHLPFDVFSRPDHILELSADGQSVPNNPNTTEDDPETPIDESNETALLPNVGGTFRYSGGAHVVIGGSDQNDRLRASIGDDTIWGGLGDDRMEGDAGNDALSGGAGDDVITDLFGVDNIKGGAGNDAISAGAGTGDLTLAGDGKDFVIHGTDEKEVFAGRGDDFVQGSDGIDTIFGNEGNDWIEGGAQSDLLQGGNQTPFEDDTDTGADVIIGDGGNDDYDSEGGDDIMVTGPGVERLEGMLGYDWVTHRGETTGQNSDMNFTGLQPPDEANVRDRFDAVEGLSGWTGNDILRGDDGAVEIGTVNQHDLTNQALITGLNQVIPPGTFSGGNNIILGGGGSDLMEGRGGNDVLDGDRQLNVQLTDGTVRADSMSQLQTRVFALTGRLNPGNINIVREIVNGGTPGNEDTAVFTGPRSEYTITNLGGGVVRVTHNNAGVDGVDTLRNMEWAQFSDVIVPLVAGVNGPPVGTVGITPGGAPVPGVALTALQQFTDPDTSPSAPDGVVDSTLVFSWQANLNPGANDWATVGVGTTFTPGGGLAGRRLRVVATYQDGDGVIQSVTSAATAPVQAPVNPPPNQAPTGLPVVTDADGDPLDGRPRVADPILANVSGIQDGNGINPATFTYLWQRSLNGNPGTFVAIGGATASSFTPTNALLGQFLRVRVRYTDNDGYAHELFSASTREVQDARTRARLLTLGRAIVPTVAPNAAVARAGITVTINTRPETSLLRIRVFRPGAKTAVARVFVKVKGNATNLKVKLNHPRIKQALKSGGRFHIELTPGVSETDLGKPTRRTIWVRFPKK